MSRGPGRIQRAIIAAFERCPKRSFTTDELVALAYPGVRRIEKKHRVAVLRAAWHVAPKYWRVGLTMSGTWGIGTGSPLLFVNQLDEVGWLRGCIRARLPWFWQQTEPEVVAAISSGDGQIAKEEPIRERAYAIWEEEGRPEGRHLDHWLRAAAEWLLEVAEAKDIPSPDWAEDYEEWRREHEIVRLQAAGEIERAVELQRACDAEREKEITSIMTKLGVGRAYAASVSRYYPGIKIAKGGDGRAVSVVMRPLGEGPPFDQVFSEIESELRSNPPTGTLGPHWIGHCINHWQAARSAPPWGTSARSALLLLVRAIEMTKVKP
jgi:hypothetical protein